MFGTVMSSRQRVMMLLYFVYAAFVLQMFLTWCEAHGLKNSQISIDQEILEAYLTSNASTEMNDTNAVRVQLDMLLSADVYADMIRTPGRDAIRTRRMRRKALQDESLRWPNATVPYTLEAEFNTTHIEELRQAMNDYHKYSCVRFRQALPGDTDYVRIVDGRGCLSWVGRKGGMQELILSKGCRKKGVIIHELGHVLGFLHEHARPDRDQYVSIKSDNILSDYRNDFKKFNELYLNVGVIPYDYQSIMHYGPYAASGNGNIVIETKNISYQNVIGQRYALSFRDAKLVNMIYRCSDRSRCRIQSCPGEGFVGSDCRCWCTSGSKKITALHCPDARQECGSIIVGSGTIRSLNYPDRYPNNLNCSWTLQAASGSEVIEVLINTLSTQGCCDFLRIFNESGTPLSFSGRVNDKKLIVGSSALVSFTTDSTQTDFGFEMEFRSIRRPSGTVNQSLEVWKPGWTRKGGSSYTVTPALSWSDARQACHSKNSILTDIGSLKEENDINDLLSSLGIARAWIGLNDRQTGSIWRWDTGGVETNLSRSKGEPENFFKEEDCVEINAAAVGKWKDRSCSTILHGICKMTRAWNQSRDGCEPGWSEIGDSCYSVTAELSWSDARQECHSKNSFLTDIRSLEDEREIFWYYRVDGKPVTVWIGLNDRQTEGIWHWDTGEVATHLPWSEGEPDGYDGREDCVEYYAAYRGELNYYRCSETLPGICKKPVADACQSGSWGFYGEWCFAFEWTASDDSGNGGHHGCNLMGHFVISVIDEEDDDGLEV